MIGPVFDWFDDFVLLVKNETVRGIIGKTQGVKIASNPPENANKINVIRDSESWLSFLLDKSCFWLSSSINILSYMFPSW